jgi:hypothetical protein
MDIKKIINYSEVSQLLTGSRNVIRANRANGKYSEPMTELIDFLNSWVLKNSKSQNATITIKTKNKI